MAAINPGDIPLPLVSPDVINFTDDKCVTFEELHDIKDAKYIKIQIPILLYNGQTAKYRSSGTIEDVEFTPNSLTDIQGTEIQFEYSIPGIENVYTIPLDFNIIEQAISSNYVLYNSVNLITLYINANEFNINKLSKYYIQCNIYFDTEKLQNQLILARHLNFYYIPTERSDANNKLLNNNEYSNTGFGINSSKSKIGIPGSMHIYENNYAKNGKLIYNSDDIVAWENNSYIFFPFQQFNEYNKISEKFDTPLSHAPSAELSLDCSLSSRSIPDKIGSDKYALIIIPDNA